MISVNAGIFFCSVLPPDSAGMVRSFHSDALGTIFVTVGDDGVISRVTFGEGPSCVGFDVYHLGEPMSDIEREIRTYLAGDVLAVRLSYRAEGTSFREKVWAELTRIPYGTTATYGQLAVRIGRAGAARAVGNACGANPVPLLIPCHRAIAAGGKLGGFTSGVWRKRVLLAIEGERI